MNSDDLQRRPSEHLSDAQQRKYAFMPILRTAAFGLTPECFPYEVDVDDSVEAQRNEGIKQNIQGLYNQDVVRLQVWLTQRSIAHVYQGVGQADVEIHDQRHDGKRVDDGLVYPG